MDSYAGDPYASIWHLCKTPSFRLPQSPPPPRPSAADPRRVEYCPFGPVPQHLLSHYLCFNPTPPNSPNNQQESCSSSLQDSQTPLNSVQDSQLPVSELYLEKNDQATTPPCCKACHEEDPLLLQGYIDTSILCVNFQDSLPPMPREDERNLGAGDPYGENSILLLEELKELALWDQDSVMDDDDIRYMVSVMSKFRKHAFVSETIMNSRYELMSELLESKKLDKVSEAKSDIYFTRSMLANANAAACIFTDLDDYNSTKKKSNEKRKESQVECEANLVSKLTDESANHKIIDLIEDMLSPQERTNAKPKVNALGNQNMKTIGCFSHCHSNFERSKSLSKTRKILLVDSDEPLLKRPKHSLGADCRISVL
ncbi:uncharacterized protein LOC111390545 [Olea europaea var. sylvestris]|uniref:uncharacterized protein LOC111390545 n=1 Tax=Olea europaea var. sylvestris TaxID=158386 RepID=UPI000C1D30A0|nr:uncharacterized protein LOC111390545 [Olea europaea var. sylvestris]XP_022871372.1 uncharacterized protein LOC111390545 [Olea europaea var. sylvestris]XP_022871375.1 uncharacterized protein LOC111390545 [Olea europaea var. sylvestris]XP_022871376.1 uncharacterized protein LOC111390545 [Olea europaea var. sylvestris]XP_022871385.1 uncharacterized protein LOC111390545 [Olea europaea var. sylvestris]